MSGVAVVTGCDERAALYAEVSPTSPSLDGTVTERFARPSAR
ncbi:hypothetical protein [Streptomyces sp. NPDC018031]